MSIDKSWINLRNRLSNQYFDGCRVFIDIAKNYTNEEGLVRCPCRKCVNGLWQPIRIVEAHIIDRGFNPLYKIWRYHGEPDLIMDPVGHEQRDNTSNEMLNKVIQFVFCQFIYRLCD